MSMLEHGTYGAKVQSWRKANPRDLLKRLIDEKPRANKEWLFNRLWDEVQEDTEMLKSMVEYWFSNNYHSLITKPVSPETVLREIKERREVKEATAAKVKKNIVANLDFQANMKLLEWMMPNGKALRDCTGKECLKAGGWLARIGSKLKPAQIVGKVFSETDVRKFFKG